MTYKIEIDVTSAVQDFYPGLSNSEVDLLAKNISENWDYSSMFNTLSERIWAVSYTHLTLPTILRV